jgi:hypothetical protein
VPFVPVIFEGTDMVGSEFDRWYAGMGEVD